MAYYSGNPAGFGMPGHMWAKRFIDLLGSHGSYSAAPQDTSSRWAACHFLYGNTHATVIPDIGHTDFFLCVGANPLVTHGSLLSVGRIKQKLADIVRRGGRVVVVDPARTKTAQAFEHVSLRPSSDSWLLAAMLKVIFDDGLVDSSLDDLAIGVERLRAAVTGIDLDDAAQRIGVTVDTIHDLAHGFATAPSACAYGRLGLCRGRYPTLANYLLDALNVVTGNFDRRGGLVFGSGLVDFPSMLAKIGRQSYGGKRSRVGSLPEVGGRLPWVLPEEILTPGPDQVRGRVHDLRQPGQLDPRRHHPHQGARAARPVRVPRPLRHRIEPVRRLHPAGPDLPGAARHRVVVRRRHAAPMGAVHRAGRRPHRGHPRRMGDLPGAADPHGRRPRARTRGR